MASASQGAPAQIDRSKVCPLLIRCFYSENRPSTAQDYRGRVPGREARIYTWKDATFREITELLKEIIVPARDPNATLAFTMVYPDKSGTNVLLHVARIHSTRSGQDDTKTLETARFQTGDYLDINIAMDR